MLGRNLFCPTLPIGDFLRTVMEPEEASTCEGCTLRRVPQVRARSLGANLGSLTRERHGYSVSSCRAVCDVSKNPGSPTF
jgi:hypothetical protein